MRRELKYVYAIINSKTGDIILTTGNETVKNETIKAILSRYNYSDENIESIQKGNFDSECHIRWLKVPYQDEIDKSRY